MTNRDPASEQLQEYAQSSSKTQTINTGYGVPVDTKSASLTVGPHGPILLQDTTYLDEITHFDRERIPERVVHAKGAGAFGYFEVTHDVTKYTKACIFSQIGKRTDLVVRFSTVKGESGSADTVRDARGFAVKFYTEEGIWDIVGNNTPIFFIRDPLLFPSLIHAQKRNPVTNLKDANMFWDFISLRPETTHQTMILFSDRGIPDGYRFMNGHGSHTFKLVNAKGEAFWCKFHYKTDQGIKNLSVEKADEIASSDPDYSTRDLYNAIHLGKYPTWTFYIQVMPVEDAKNCKFNPFDLTKVWPHADFPMIPVGKIVLNRNPSNYFTDVEQVAFGPDHLIPGIEPSPDIMLQGRLFAYSDTHRHRLGPNFLQLPVNCPYRVTLANQQRDGPQCYHNQGGAPNYYPNSFKGPSPTPSAAAAPFEVSGVVARYESGDNDNFSQAKLFWKNVLKPDERTRLINNIVDSLKNAVDFIQERTVKNFANVDEELGVRLRDGLQLTKKNKANL